MALTFAFTRPPLAAIDGLLLSLVSEESSALVASNKTIAVGAGGHEEASERRLVRRRPDVEEDKIRGAGDDGCTNASAAKPNNELIVIIPERSTRPATMVHITAVLP